MNKIDFYYWGDQCPHNCKMRELLDSFSNDSRCTINCYDISKEKNSAKNLNIFSPNMVVINDKIRLHGPISKNKIEDILNDIMPNPKPYVVEMSNEIIKGKIKDITEDTILDTCMLCASSEKKNYCKDKGKWIKNIVKSFNLPHLGKLHYLNDVCIGGAEFVPSLIVPYSIPKSEDAAFLTCSFGTSEEGDYRSYPLQLLEEELPSLGYKAIFTIASEDTPFPNGTLNWFLNRGYADLGFLVNEEMHFARMHLVKKQL